MVVDASVANFLFGSGSSRLGLNCINHHPLALIMCQLRSAVQQERDLKIVRIGTTVSRGYFSNSSNSARVVTREIWRTKSCGVSLSAHS